MTFRLGLDTIHQLTSSRNYTLRIELTDWEGESRYAEYTHFMVGDEQSGYQLDISGYSGTAGDSMAYHNGMKFSTYDHNHNRPCENCATVLGFVLFCSCTSLDSQVAHHVRGSLYVVCSLLLISLLVGFPVLIAPAGFGLLFLHSCWYHRPGIFLRILCWFELCPLFLDIQ